MQLVLALDKILWHEAFYNAYLGIFIETPHIVLNKLGKFVWGESSCGSNFGCGASAALFSAVRKFLATIFGAMPFDFAVEALVVLHQLCFLFFRVIGESNCVDVHVMSSLRGGAFSSIWALFDSKCSV